MQPPPQRPEPPAIGGKSSKPQWTDPSLSVGPSVQPNSNFEFPAVDPRAIARQKLRRRSETMRIYLSLAAVIVLMGAFAVWQLVQNNQRTVPPDAAPPASPAAKQAR